MEDPPRPCPVPQASLPIPPEPKTAHRFELSTGVWECQDCSFTFDEGYEYEVLDEHWTTCPWPLVVTSFEAAVRLAAMADPVARLGEAFVDFGKVVIEPTATSNIGSRFFSVLRLQDLRQRHWCARFVLSEAARVCWTDPRASKVLNTIRYARRLARSQIEREERILSGRPLPRRWRQRGTRSAPNSRRRRSGG